MSLQPLDLDNKSHSETKPARDLGTEWRTLVNAPTPSVEKGSDIPFMPRQVRPIGDPSDSARPVPRWRFVALLLAFVSGCAFERPTPPVAALSERILPPADFLEMELEPVEILDEPTAETRWPMESRPTAAELTRPSTETHSEDLPDQNLVEEDAPVASSSYPTHLAARAPSPMADCDTSADPLTLARVIELSYQSSPRLQYIREQVDASRGGRQMAFAGFLPEAKTIYRHVEGVPRHEKFGLPTIPTLAGNYAFGGVSDNFQIAELHLQWTVWDFGRTSGRYGEATSAEAIAELLYQRARQTLAFNVTAAYLRALDAQANHAIAREAVRRADSHLRDARHFLARGAYDKNDLFRAELQLAEMKLYLVTTETSEALAIADLNRVMGINVTTQTRLVETEPLSSSELSLASGLRLAVDNRREFAAAIETVKKAQFAAGVAKADFYPKVALAAGGSLLDGEDIDNAALLAGGLTVELGLFEGGRHLGADRTAKAEVRAAVARAKEICDTIAYEVNDAFLAVRDARQRIELARAAVKQATENLRVYNRRFARGDATPTDVVDAELSMTRSQQNYNSALYDHQIAIAKMAYAVGTDTYSFEQIMNGTSGTRDEPLGENIAVNVE